MKQLGDDVAFGAARGLNVDSGTSHAASSKLLPKNSVGSQQVINKSLRQIDFKPGQLPRGPRGLAGVRGPVGAAGPVGPSGPAGPSGAGGVTKVTTLDTAPVAMCPSGLACSTGDALAICPSGSFVVGGGFATSSADVDVVMARATTATSYAVIATNSAATVQTISAQAICASGPGLSPG